MLIRRLAGQRGMALVPAMLVMAMLISFGIATAALVDSDQSTSRREREQESSFQLTEGALNAQIFRLSSRWPGATAQSSDWYPASCGVSSSSQDCPTASTLRQQFTGVDYTTATDWVTQVRDNGGATPNYWSDDLLTSQPTYDRNDDNFLWVRASATIHGRKRAVVALVEAENTLQSFPRAALVSGHFATTNNGNKVIIDTNGDANQFSPGDIIVRCSMASLGCADYDDSKGQVTPNTVRSNPTQPRAVSVDALDQLRDRAKADGNYYASGCPSSLAGDQPGETVFIENGSCSYGGNSTFNTAANPGVVVIARGSLGFGGTSTYYGLIYHANLDNLATDVVSIGGTACITGSVVIDGAAGLSAGASKENLIYDPNAVSSLKSLGTVSMVQNTFREITAP